MEDRIKSYLQFRMPQTEDLHITRIERQPWGNSKETVLVDAEWKENGRQVSRGFCFRIELRGSVVESPGEHEFRVMKALESSLVPVPKQYWLETDEKWLGRRFFVMEKVVGDMDTGMITDPETRRRMMKLYLEVLAHQHNADWEKLGLSWMGAPKEPLNSAAMVIGELEASYNRNRLEPHPILVEVFTWLKNNEPMQVECISLIHGDPGPGNFIVNQGKIVAVHDWEMSHLGDPMDDLGWLCWREAVTGGVVDRGEILRYYQDVSGIKVNEESVHYYEIIANVKAAICCITGGRAFCDGRNLNLVMASVGLGGGWSLFARSRFHARILITGRDVSSRISSTLWIICSETGISP